MIDKLTKEQEDAIPKYVNKWLQLGYRTNPIDKEKAIEAVHFVYNLAKAELPSEIVFLNSPMECQVEMRKKNLQLYPQLYSQLDSQLYSQLRSQLISQLNSPLASQLRSQLESRLYSQLNSQLNSQLESQLYSQLHSQLGSQYISHNYYINLWYQGGYYGFYDYVLNELFPEKKNEFPLFYEFINHMKELHYIYTFKNVCYVSDFSSEIHVNKQGKLHNVEGPALSYRDNYSLYSFNGKVKGSLMEVVMACRNER